MIDVSVKVKRTCAKGHCPREGVDRTHLFFLSIPFATLLDKRGANGRLHLHRDAGSEAHLCVAHRDAPPHAKRIQPPAGAESLRSSNRGL